MDILDLIEKGGLLRFMWQNAINLLTQRADNEKNCADVVAEGGATGLAGARTAANLSASDEVGRVESGESILISFLGLRPR